MSFRASNLIFTPVLAVHGAKDDIVPITYSEMMVENINRTGGKAELIVLDEYGHNDAINYAYMMQEVIDFILNSKRNSFESVKEFCSEWF